MKRSIFQLKFLTPALIAGSQPKTVGQAQATAELREASIRGQLRWWHRFLGYDRVSEQRIYGAAAGSSGHASGVLLRILDAPTPIVEPQSARDLDLHPQGGIVEYMAFNLRWEEGKASKEDVRRSALPAGTEFHVLLQSGRLTEVDWMTLLHTMEVFSWLGSLGTRSRRCFGSLTLLSKDGKACQRPASWSSLIGSQNVEARTVPGKEAREWRDLFRQAGGWLREQRGIVANKNLLFGTAGSRQRIASAILLRPDLVDGRFTLLAIGRQTDLNQTSLATLTYEPLPESSDL
jgi:CRISPR type III-B/RAMP module RAMP protein Cmr1